MAKSISYKDIYEIIGEFRKENNLRFDKIEEIFKKHLEDNEKRISSLERLGDKVLLVAGIVGGGIGLLVQLIVGLFKKEIKI